MYSTKLVFVVSLLTVIALYQVHAAISSHNFTVGYRLPGDRLILTTNIEAKSKLWQVVTLERTFNVTNRWDRITKVEAIDRRLDGTGAYVSLLKGGPSYQNVTLRFKSQRNHGIHFMVNLYAR